MKTLLLFLIIIFSGIVMSAQEVVASSGSSGTRPAPAVVVPSPVTKWTGLLESRLLKLSPVQQTF